MNASVMGILGGMFDPVHLGHLCLAQAVVEKLPLDTIRFIPCHTPPHRKLPTASAQDRLAMLQAAVAEDTRFVIDDREYKNAGISYTVDTLASLRAEFPENPLCLIMANDEFCQFDHWHRYREILDFAHLVVANRPNHALPYSTTIQALLQAHETQDKKQIINKPCGHIIRIDIPALDIASSQIRHTIQAKKSATQLVPQAVWQYICTHQLYCKDPL